jgi:hypothetical protein
MSEMSQEMSESTPPAAKQAGPQGSPASPVSSARFRIIALAVILLVVGIVLWLALRHTGSSKSHALNASAVSETQLNNLATTAGHPVFWIGSKSGYTYELSQSPNGNIYVRYLPAGVAVGSSKPYLTVGTYPFAGAYAALQTVSRQNGETHFRLAHGGLAVVASSYPDSVHIAYPGVDYQVEVYDPTPGVASALVAGGKVAAFGNLAPAAKPRAISAAGLRALAKSLKHSIYWVGAKKGDTYEVTETSNGQVYLRYLPSGVAVGAGQAYLTVATYPYPGALAALQAVSKTQGNSSFKLPGGGLAEFSTSDPRSVHVAFPGSDYQIEVFDPSAGAARRLVSSGQLTAIG